MTFPKYKGLVRLEMGGGEEWEEKVEADEEMEVMEAEGEGEEKEEVEEEKVEADEVMEVMEEGEKEKEVEKEYWWNQSTCRWAHFPNCWQSTECAIPAF